MPEILNTVNDASYYGGGYVSFAPLMESYRPGDMAHFQRVQEMVKHGLFRAALMEYDRERAASRTNRALREAMVTADLPILLAGGVDLHFRTAYNMISENWRACFPANTDFVNFREQKFANLTDLQTNSAAGTSENGLLPVVPERHAYNEATLGEEYEVATMKTYGATFFMTRQMLMNDDKGALREVPQALGIAARRTRNYLVAQVLEGTYTCKDGVALFDASTHGNYTSAGTALTLLNLEAEVQKFLLQASPSGRALRVRPKFLIIPPDLEVTAMTILGDAANTLLATALGSTSAAALRGAGNALNFITPVVLEELTDTNDWYLAADPAIMPTIEAAPGFAGTEGPELLVQENMDLSDPDGIKHKVRMDFVAYCRNWRGIRKVTGA